MGDTSTALADTHLPEFSGRAKLNIIYLRATNAVRCSFYAGNSEDEVTVPAYMGGTQWWLRRFRAFLGRIEESHRLALYRVRPIARTGAAPEPDVVPFLVYVASLHNEWCDDDELEMVKWARRCLLRPIAKAAPRSEVSCEQR